MAIKPDAQSFFPRKDEEWELAGKLDEAFDINFRNVAQGLSYWLAEPRPFTKERFGIQQEVLVIFSQHFKTDARVLTTIEGLARSPDFKFRIDKVVFLLIHHGSQEDTEKLVKKATDRIIIPIHANELKNPTRGDFFIRARIAHYIGTVDLFGMSSAITSDRYFFGRDDLVQKLIARSVVQKENSGIFGLRKTGKTSVLRAFERRIDDKPILTEYVECSNPGIHANRWWQVLENLAERLALTVRRELKKRECKIVGNYTPENAGTRFSSDVKSILEFGELEQLILMLDEIEYITHSLSGALGKHWDEDFVPFWQTIRSTHQETKGRLVFLVAGVNPSCVETSHFGNVQNPIFQLATPHYLEPFTLELTREMVRSIGKYAGIHFNEDVFPYLQSTYGGHPFLVRIACSQIWKTTDILSPDRHATISIKDFETLSDEIKSRLSSPIKDILLSLVWWYPDEYDLLSILAGGDEGFVADYLKHEPKSIFQFARYGILKKDKLSEFAIKDIRDFLLKYGGLYKNVISPFARGDMPPEVLPQVPDLEIVSKLFEKRTSIEISLRKAILMYLNVKHTFDPQKISVSIISGLPRRNDRPEPKDLFVGRPPQDAINQLYCPDLKAIILTNWDIFAPLFDNKKDRFEMNMDTLNVARRIDAHTKPISKKEAEDFENSYAWLLNRLSVISA